MVLGAKRLGYVGRNDGLKVEAKRLGKKRPRGTSWGRNVLLPRIRQANLTILQKAPKWLLTEATRDQFSVKYFVQNLFKLVLF